MTITLTWKSDDTDLDLHVLEPEEGRHIAYFNMGKDTKDRYPYLDFDNR